MVNNPPAMQEILGLEYPLEKGMTILSNILGCIIVWTEKPGGLSP